MLRTILIGLEESASCNAAVELGIRWARRFEALLTGVAIVDQPAICKPEPVPIGAGVFKRERDETLLTQAHERVDDLLHNFARRCAARDLRCETLKEVGSPASRIVARAKVSDIVMIGQQANFHALTSEWDSDTIMQLVRQTSRPVVITPDAIPDAQRALIAYNGSVQADRALQAFVALGLAEEYELHIAVIDSDLPAAESLARQAAEYFELHDLAAHVHPREPLETLAATIIQQTWDLQAGIVVMGAFGRSWVRELVLGSTTTEVLSNSRVPVFLTH